MGNCKKPLIAMAIMSVLSGSGVAHAEFIAGVDASKRPENAPVITKAQKPADWYEKALHGVTAPYPYSLHFLENQGNWFNPFIHPGMRGRYDIRGWYQKK